MRPTPRLIATFLFGSGLAALVYQTAWQRSFRLVFGASTGASAAVLGIFLGGLGLGGALLGRRAERSERPLQLYGTLELLVSVTAALTPSLIDGLGSVYFWTGGSTGLGWAGATAVRLVIAVLVMGAPVVLMGGTLPAAARAAESEEDAARSTVATLYALNTIGAVTGALMATFVLFEVFGTRLSLYLAALVNALLGVVARAVGRTTEPIAGRPAADASSEAESSEEPVASVPRLLVYAVAAVAGFAFLALELVWYRMLGPILGGTSFTFGLIVATALGGIGLGGFVYSRRDASERPTLALLALTLALEALAVAAPLVLGDAIAVYAANVRDLGALGFGALMVGWASVAAAVVLPASMVSGYQFPVLLGLLGQGRKGVAREVGLAYAANTGGSILGAVLGGFVLIPALGAVGTWRLLAVLLAVVAVAAVGVSVLREPRRSRPIAAVASLASILGVVSARAEGPTAAWRHSPIGAGRLDLSGVDQNGLLQWRSSVNDEVVWEVDGVESAVALVDDNGYAFVVNGKNDGNVLGDRGTAIMSGLLPALLHRAPRRAFVVGLGSGMTAGWLAEVPGMERVDVAELEPAIVDVARACASANHDVVDHDRVVIDRGDGRELLLTRNVEYDLVVSEPSNPYRAGIASLFTREFYRAVAARLAPGGRFAQWLQAYEVNASTVRMTMRTLLEVFPVVNVWQTQHGDFLFVAEWKHHPLDAERLRQRIAKEPFATGLRRAWMVEDLEGVLAHFVADFELLDSVSADAPLNTDDANYLEFAFARSLGTSPFDATTSLLLTARDTGHARPNVRGSVDWERVEEERSRAWLIVLGEKPPVFTRTPAATHRANAVRLGCIGEVEQALVAWRSQPRSEPMDLLEHHVLAQALAQRGDAAANRSIRALERGGFHVEARLARARMDAANGDREGAVESLISATDSLRHEPLTLCYSGFQVLEMLSQYAVVDRRLAARVSRALLRGPFASHVENRKRVDTAQKLAFASGDSNLCVEALGDRLTEPLWVKWFLEGRARCLRGVGHPLADRAEADLREYYRRTGGSF